MGIRQEGGFRRRRSWRGWRSGLEEMYVALVIEVQVGEVAVGYGAVGETQLDVVLVRGLFEVLHGGGWGRKYYNGWVLNFYEEGKGLL